MTALGILRDKVNCANAHILGILSLFAAASLLAFGTASAETGVGTDIFKVILTIIGADKVESGDIVALVTVNDHSRVKFFELQKGDLNIRGSNTSESSTATMNNKLIEYVATFPNVTVSSGDQYKACVLPLKSLKIICVEGHNSPAKRPEFVDISLNSTKNSSNEDGSTEGTVTNQSALVSSSGLDSSSSSDAEKQHKKKKSDKVDEATTTTDIDPAFNIDQNP